MAAVDFKLIKNFINKHELPIIQNYCYHKLDSHKDFVLDLTFSPTWNYDSLMTSLLYNKLNFVEKISKLKLFPTYAYWRYYVFGGSLPHHLDRPACEISISACIKKYDNWPIKIEDKTFELEEGDGLLYAGCDQWHGRPGIYKGDGLAQVFLHYVNQNGPNKHHAYDIPDMTKERR
tara:strand:+ start:782 stop:1309 length:528 start_codon:yes stop_codon:yes gene_type:complete